MFPNFVLSGIESATFSFVSNASCRATHTAHSSTWCLLKFILVYLQVNYVIHDRNTAHRWVRCPGVQ